MAKNRVMAQKNAKVRKCDAEMRKERKLAHFAFQKREPLQDFYRLNRNNEVELYYNVWAEMYAELN